MNRIIFLPIRFFYFKQRQKTLKKQSQNATLTKLSFKPKWLHEDDDPVTKRIPQQIFQPLSRTVHTLLSEIQNLHFNDSHLSQDNLTIMTTSSPPKSDDFIYVDSPLTNAWSKLQLNLPLYLYSIFTVLRSILFCSY